MAGTTGAVVLSVEGSRRWVGSLSSGGGARCRGAGWGVRASRLIVEEVETATEAERVFVWLVVGLSLRLGPELVWVLGYGGSSCRRRRLGEEGIWFHFAELSSGEASPSVREGEGAVALFVDGNCHTMQHHGLAVPGLGGFHYVSGQVV